MFTDRLQELLHNQIKFKKEDGTYKSERVIISPQGSEIELTNSNLPLINFCSNNYLGLSNHPSVISAINSGLEQRGFGMSSVRFICGTTDYHKELEDLISGFLLTDDTILYSSCFDANGGLFENLLNSDDTIISATLNHASIIDGIRLSKAKRRFYSFNNMTELETQLNESRNSRITAIISDGVFSMEGELAPLDEIAELSEKYDALLIVDDSHATGFIGNNGRGTAEYYNVQDKIDLFTGTLGKALGGANGGYISGKKELIEWFRNTSRPYLFSNSLSPALVSGAIESLKIVMSKEGKNLRESLEQNVNYFRDNIKKKGFTINDGNHPIVPIMIGDAKTAHNMADDLLLEGIYVIAFSFPVVPENEARIRVQISALHSFEQIDTAISAFEKVAKKYNILN